MSKLHLTNGSKYVILKKLSVRLFYAQKIILTFPNEYYWCLNEFKNRFTLYYKKSELIASIPFIRNIIKYTKSNKDYDYLTLTNVLHLKEETMNLKPEDIYEIFETTIRISLTFNRLKGDELKKIIFKS